MEQAWSRGDGMLSLDCDQVKKWISTLMSVDQHLSSPPLCVPVSLREGLRMRTEQAGEKCEEFLFPRTF